jgi:hypothetical protein
MFTDPRRVGRWIAIALAIGLFCFSQALAKKPDNPGGGGSKGPSYSIVQLDDAGGAYVYGWPRDINNLGQIVGSVDEGSPFQNRQAAYWQISTADGGIQSTLSLLSAGITAHGINNLGEIVGQGTDVDGRLVGMYWAGPDAAPVVLPPLPGHDRSSGLGINDHGVVCGRSVIAGVGPSRAVAWRVNWIDGTPTVSEPVELPAPEGESSAYSINDNDADGIAEIAGSVDVSSTSVVWAVQSQPNGSLIAAPLPEVLDGNATAWGINNGGTVCGERDAHAVVWSGGSSHPLNEPRKGVALSYAYDVNDDGMIVGIGGPGIVDRRAVFWPSASDKMVFLDDFLGRNSPFTLLTDAEAVNDLGEIVGRGIEGAFVAVPE